MFRIRDWLILFEDGTLIVFEARTKRSALTQANQIAPNHGPIQEVYKRVA